MTTLSTDTIQAIRDSRIGMSGQEILDLFAKSSLTSWAFCRFVGDQFMHRHNFIKFRAFIFMHCETASVEFIQHEWELYKSNNLGADAHDVTCLYAVTFGRW